jgi:hypothetical protein
MNQGVRTIIYPVKDMARAKMQFRTLLGVEPYSDQPYYVGFRVGDQDIGLDPNGHKNEGAILFPEYAVGSWWGWSILTQSGLFDNDKKLVDYTDEEMELLLHSKPYKVKISGTV